MGSPFIVYALGRSRSAWLARFLTYGDWVTCHEVAMKMRRWEDVTALFRIPNTGCVETAAAHGWRLLHHHIPDLRAVVVRRPTTEVVNSMMALDIGGFCYDRQALTQTIERGEREMQRISQQPGTLTVDFSDLSQESTCGVVFKHCLGQDMPHEWWLRWKDQNIQVDVRSLLEYYHSNIDSIMAFKRGCKSELRRLAYAGAF